MSKLVLVETISTFRHRYCIEVPDSCEEEMTFHNGTRSFPVTPEEWAMDTVTCEEAEEISQYHVGEQITSARQITMQDYLNIFDQDNDYLKEWSDEQKQRAICRYDDNGNIISGAAKWREEERKQSPLDTRPEFPSNEGC